MRTIIEMGPDAWEQIRAAQDRPAEHATRELASLKLLAPVPNPIRVRDCTLFTNHIEPALRAMARRRAEGAADPESEYQRMLASGAYDLPEIFEKQFVYYNADHLSTSGPGDVITAPPTSRDIDYELEFAVVLGCGGIDIPERQARSHIFGFVIFNDWSARDVQSEVMESTLGPAEGKDFEGSNTFGPFLVTADEVGDPYQLGMRALVNGEEWSRGRSDSMAYSFEFAIAHLSRGKRLFAGDIIGSGTVASGCGFELGRRLNDGDEVQLEIDRLGALRNVVRYR
ncbi:fumarylacetoacetate hydrolase family protein [[Mycobacterium] wendilense]|uniref:Fumarylacetoacetate hydrolase family protein n=1 Tax=[Mycobacterium] wendilense TaxID=3064284 RepID=A0ABM9MKH0_9MYCO|nr:fumarylacetoacetate hydrolase family protein [Mycolicibacterium sp. MU0050]CAJ1587480.1 fumarylacetoacetate hydrolase family protein [Mycolicibacterium sp. MU0050]